MRIGRVVVVLAILSVCLTALAHAGKNAGGALVVHTDDQFSSTMFPPPFCEWIEYHTPGSCEELECQSNFYDPNFLLGGMVWVFAAFPEGSTPGVGKIHFGIEHSFEVGYMAAWGLCGHPDNFETPDAGWPQDWENAGTTVTLGAPIAEETLFPFYYFGCYGDIGDFLGTGIHPTLGYAGFVSDDDPGVLDEIDRFGQVRWFEPGFNECPEPFVPGACCFDDGSCASLYEHQCIETGGYHWIVDLSCDPNPCIPSHVQEPQFEILPWGKIKAQYR